MDNVPTATGYNKTAKKQVAFTSYMQNMDCPEWDGERLQLLLTPGGDRPIRLCAEVWDKDMYTPDEQLAGTVVTLPEGMRSGVIKVRLPGVVAGADVEELRFSFELLAEAEPEQKTRKNSLLKPGTGRSNSRIDTGLRSAALSALAAQKAEKARGTLGGGGGLLGAAMAATAEAALAGARLTAARAETGVEGAAAAPYASHSEAHGELSAPLANPPAAGGVRTWGSLPSSAGAARSSSPGAATAATRTPSPGVAAALTRTRTRTQTRTLTLTLALAQTQTRTLTLTLTLTFTPTQASRPRRAC